MATALITGSRRPSVPPSPMSCRITPCHAMNSARVTTNDGMPTWRPRKPVKHADGHPDADREQHLQPRVRREADDQQEQREGREAPRPTRSAATPRARPPRPEPTNSTNTVVPIAPSRLPLRHEVQRHHRGGQAGRGARRQVDLAGEQHEHQAHRDDGLPGALLEQVGQVEQARERLARQRREQDEQREQAQEGGQRAEVAAAQLGERRRGSPRRSSSRWCRSRSRPTATGGGGAACSAALAGGGPRPGLFFSIDVIRRSRFPDAAGPARPSGPR